MVRQGIPFNIKRGMGAANASMTTHPRVSGTKTTQEASSHTTFKAISGFDKDIRPPDGLVWPLPNRGVMLFVMLNTVPYNL